MLSFKDSELWDSKTWNYIQGILPLWTLMRNHQKSPHRIELDPNISLIPLSTATLNTANHNDWYNWNSSIKLTEIVKQTHFSKLCEWTLLHIFVLNLEEEYYTQHWISICGNCKIVFASHIHLYTRNLPAMHPKFICSCYL